MKTSHKILTIYAIVFVAGAVALMGNGVMRARELSRTMNTFYEQLATTPIRVVLAEGDVRLSFVPKYSGLDKAIQRLTINDPMDRATFRIAGDTLHIAGEVEVHGDLPRLEHLIVNGKEQTVLEFNYRTEPQMIIRVGDDQK